MDISSFTQSLFEEVTNHRRKLHKIPELANCEVQTGHYIVEYLKQLDPDKIEVKTGIKAVFYANGAKKTIAFRADMDALPISEQAADRGFISQNSGCMHACGHDTHMAIALTLARVVAEKREKLACNIVFLFQPAEECFGGALRMIQDGVLKDPKVDEIYGLHIWPYIEAGKIGIKSGPLMARVNDIDIYIKGKSAHGAKPQDGKDAVVATAYFINAVQSIVSRNVDPAEMAVITIGKVQGGRSRNVICENITLECTIRSYSDDMAAHIQKRLEDMLKGLEEMFSVKTRMVEESSYPIVSNDVNLYEGIKTLVKKGEYVYPRPEMMAEDFSFFQREVPGMFIFIGSKDDTYHEPLHSSRFDLDEANMLSGLEIYLRLLGINE